MIIQDIVNLAKYSELFGVAVKDDIDAITSFINLGMVELYTRFPIHIEEYVITLQDNVTYYDMPADFMYAIEAYGESTETGKVQTIPLAINEDHEPYGIFFNDWNTVQVPEPVTGAFISILYATKPTAITAEQAQDGTTELDLPDPLVDCLLSYLGYRAHLGVRGDAQSENNAHWLRFERNCTKARELGVAFPMDSLNMPTRVTDRGFA